MLCNKKLPFAIFSKKKKSPKFNKQIRIGSETIYLVPSLKIIPLAKHTPKVLEPNYTPI